MISKGMIKECTEASEASIRSYLNQFFCMKELSFSQFKRELFSGLQIMLAEDIKKVPGSSFSCVSWLTPADPLRTPDAVVTVRDMAIPEHLGNIKCYRFALKDSVDEFIREYYCKGLKELDLEEREAAFWAEKRKIELMTVFYPSSLLPFIHHQCPIIEGAMEEYRKFESLKELQHLVSGLSPYTGCNRPKRDFKRYLGATS